MKNRCLTDSTVLTLSAVNEIYIQGASNTIYWYIYFRMGRVILWSYPPPVTVESNPSCPC